jgi:low temperature requirement protein LtrA
VANFILLILNLFTQGIIQSIIFWIIPILNFAPPFFRQFRRNEQFNEFNLSPGMTERLGLIVIIVFGENILGVINGLDNAPRIPVSEWMVFGLGILIVFLLWWIYFSIIADREVRRGFWNAQIFILGFIPILASLGAAGATFSVVMKAQCREQYPPCGNGQDYFRSRYRGFSLERMVGFQNVDLSCPV